MPEGHPAVGDELVERGVAHALKKNLEDRDDPAGEGPVGVTEREADGVGGERERERDQGRRQRQDRPVEDRALRPRAHAPHLEDAVHRHEEFVDQEERRQRQARETENPETGGVGRKLPDVLDDRLALLRREEAVEDHGFEFLPVHRKARERCEGGERHGKKRDEREERGERHRARHLLELRVLHAHPGEAEERARHVDHAVAAHQGEKVCGRSGHEDLWERS